jgi:MoaA/NifB/PqqE/SkfB family radical SAM enzyme
MHSRQRYKFLYLWKFMQTITSSKLINLYLNRREFKALTPELKSYPPQVIIDITNICNLKCPLCPTGMGITDRPKGKMSLEDFGNVLDQLQGKTVAVHLYNWGEPLLLGNFPEYCEMAYSKGFVVSVSSNLTMQISQEQMRHLVKSGLARIIVSFDGLKAESYLRYRIGGNYERLRENIGNLIHLRNSLKMKYPLIVLQLVRHKTNQRDADYLSQAASELGVDSYHIVDALLPFGEGRNEAMIREWISPDRLVDKDVPYDIRKSELHSPCSHLWKYPVINHDRSISPCCFVYRPDNDFANLQNQSFIDGWNSARYNQARKAFSQRVKTDGLPCSECSILKTYLNNEGED